MIPLGELNSPAALVGGRGTWRCPWLPEGAVVILSKAIAGVLQHCRVYGGVCGFQLCLSLLEAFTTYSEPIGGVTSSVWEWSWRVCSPSALGSVWCCFKLFHLCLKDQFLSSLTWELSFGAVVTVLFVPPHYTASKALLVIWGSRFVSSLVVRILPIAPADMTHSN